MNCLCNFSVERICVSAYLYFSVCVLSNRSFHPPNHPTPIFLNFSMLLYITCIHFAKPENSEEGDDDDWVTVVSCKNPFEGNSLGKLNHLQSSKIRNWLVQQEIPIAIVGQTQSPGVDCELSLLTDWMTEWVSEWKGGWVTERFWSSWYVHLVRSISLWIQVGIGWETWLCRF